MLEQWSVRLAEAIAPDEAALAPLVVHAYATGGKERTELFREAENTYGAFGAGEMVAILPFALKALAVAGPAILGLLKSDIVADLFECLKNALSLLEIGHGMKTVLASRGANGVAHAPQLDLLRNVIEEIPRQLRASGLSDDKCNETTLGILRVLLADPQAAQQAIAQLGRS